LESQTSTAAAACEGVEEEEVDNPVNSSTNCKTFSLAASVFLISNPTTQLVAKGDPESSEEKAYFLLRMLLVVENMMESPAPPPPCNSDFDDR
jgi:hypothetical protein